jgi:LPS export ABC transporter protein LptC
LLGGFILLLLVVLAVTLWPKGEEADSLTGLVEKLPPGVDLGLENVHYSQNEAGRKSWELDAGRAEYQRDAGELTLNEVRFVYYLDRDSGRLTTSSQQGTFNRNSRQLFLNGEVVVVADSGEKLQTQSLHYDLENKQARTDGLVQIENSHLKLRGTGMLLDVEQKHLSLFADVRAIFYLPASDGTEQ